MTPPERPSDSVMVGARGNARNLRSLHINPSGRGAPGRLSRFHLLFRRLDGLLGWWPVPRPP